MFNIKNALLCVNNLSIVVFFFFFDTRISIIRLAFMMILLPGQQRFNRKNGEAQRTNGKKKENFENFPLVQPS